MAQTSQYVSCCSKRRNFNRASSKFQVKVFEAEYKNTTIQNLARTWQDQNDLQPLRLKRMQSKFYPSIGDDTATHPETIHPDRYAHLLPAFQPNKELVFTSAEDSESDLRTNGRMMKRGGGR